MVVSEFSVSWIHRLGSTADIWGADQHILSDVLEPSDGQLTRVLCIVDNHVLNTQPELGDRIRAFFEARLDAIQLTHDIISVPGGESIKNDRTHVKQILGLIHDAQLDRRNYVLAIGGGAVLDAVGFAAAVAHRGIRLVRLPTTTLSQADSGVGVKNSVNWFGQKNWIGTFAVPWAVINDTSMLLTLPDRDFRCGFSEAVKVALLKNAAFFDQLCSNAHRIAARDADASAAAIYDSAQYHLQHITCGGDPFERLEARPLDFGHWSAHRLEVLTNFELRHGEAVAIGVAVDAVYSSLVFGLPEEDMKRILCCLRDLKINMFHPQLKQIEALFDGLDEFRQHLGGQLTLTMLRDIGHPLEVHDVDRSAMRQAIDRVIDFACDA